MPLQRQRQGTVHSCQRLSFQNNIKYPDCLGSNCCKPCVEATLRRVRRVLMKHYAIVRQVGIIHIVCKALLVTQEPYCLHLHLHRHLHLHLQLHWPGEFNAGPHSMQMELKEVKIRLLLSYIDDIYIYPVLESQFMNFTRAVHMCTFSAKRLDSPVCLYDCNRDASMWVWVVLPGSRLCPLRHLAQKHNETTGWVSSVTVTVALLGHSQLNHDQRTGFARQVLLTDHRLQITQVAQI